MPPSRNAIAWTARPSVQSARRPCISTSAACASIWGSRESSRSVPFRPHHRPGAGILHGTRAHLQRHAATGTGRHQPAGGPRRRFLAIGIAIPITATLSGDRAAKLRSQSHRHRRHPECGLPDGPYSALCTAAHNAAGDVHRHARCRVCQRESRKTPPAPTAASNYTIRKWCIQPYKNMSFNLQSEFI